MIRVITVDVDEGLYGFTVGSEARRTVRISDPVVREFLEYLMDAVPAGQGVLIYNTEGTNDARDHAAGAGRAPRTLRGDGGARPGGGPGQLGRIAQGRAPRA